MQDQTMTLQQSVDNQAPFHIAFCIDERFFMPMGVTITSIIKNNPDQHFVFHVFTFDLSEDQINRTKAFEQNPQIKVHFHSVNLKDFSQFERYIADTTWSLTIFIRIIVPEILKNYCDKVLYLDADILCIGKLDELINLDISNYMAAVVPDARETAEQQIKKINLQHNNYFNSGMMLINLPLWTENKITLKAFELLKDLNDKNITLSFGDQDCLNLILDGKALYISIRWDYIFNISTHIEHGNTKLTYVNQPVIVHFAGQFKPWAGWLDHDAVTLFKSYHQQSPWKDIPLEKAPAKTKFMRIYAHSLMKQKKPIESIKWFIQYARAHRQDKKKKAAAASA